MNAQQSVWNNRSSFECITKQLSYLISNTFIWTHIKSDCIVSESVSERDIDGEKERERQWEEIEAWKITGRCMSMDIITNVTKAVENYIENQLIIEPNGMGQQQQPKKDEEVSKY